MRLSPGFTLIAAAAGLGVPPGTQAEAPRVPAVTRTVLAVPARYDLSKETVEIKTIWQAPMWTAKTVNLTSFNYNTMLASFRGNTYIVYVDDDRRPRVVRIAGDGGPTSAHLDPDEGDVYRSRNDGHHTFAIGVDELGYLHVSGDMHGYGSGKAYDHMPDRYNPRKTGGKCMYWRSKRPGDISEFVWLGADEKQRPRGDYFSYMAFVNDANGRLYYYSRQRRNGPRQMLWVASRYDATAGTWSFIGGTDGTPHKMPLTIWENGGENANHYVRSQGWMLLDRRNRLHAITTVIMGEPKGPKGGHWVTDCVYVNSGDFGVTSRRMDGTPVPWPARAKEGPNQGEVVHSKQFMATPVSMSVDLEGSPVVLLKAGSGFLVHWDAGKKQWVAYPPIGGRKVFTDPQGVITVLDGSILRRMWHPSEEAVTHNHGRRVHLIDREHLRRTGNIRGLTGSAGELVLLEVRIQRPATYLPLRLNTLTLDVPEGGTAELRVQPQFKIDEPAEVQVVRLGGDPDLLPTTTEPLRFDLSNWNRDQTVTFEAREDADGVNGTARFRLRSRLGRVEFAVREVERGGEGQ